MEVASFRIDQEANLKDGKQGEKDEVWKSDRCPRSSWHDQKAANIQRKAFNALLEDWRTIPED